jgi:hypothetical protein
MDAVLPKQSKDMVSGKLFVMGYQRVLQGYPKDAIAYLAEQSMRRCRWFPTIAECIDIIDEWRRDDADVRQRQKAQQIANRERKRRQEIESMAKRQPLPEITPEQIEEMSPNMIEIGIKCGALMRLDDGTVIATDA